MVLTLTLLSTEMAFCNSFGFGHFLIEIGGVREIITQSPCYSAHFFKLTFFWLSRNVEFFQDGKLFDCHLVRLHWFFFHCIFRQPSFFSVHFIRWDWIHFYAFTNVNKFFRVNVCVCMRFIWIVSLWRK